MVASHCATRQRLLASAEAGRTALTEAGRAASALNDVLTAVSDDENEEEEEEEDDDSVFVSLSSMVRDSLRGD